MPVAQWRAMRAADIDGVAQVAAVAFPDHPEDRACFEERLALHPQGCFVLADGAGIAGYLVSYPWPLSVIPPLNSLIGTLPDQRDTIYLHDLALLPRVQGQGHARPIVERLAGDARATGARHIALVSVNGSVPFWQRLGFAPMCDDPAIEAKLATYGGGSAYMVRATGL